MAHGHSTGNRLNDNPYATLLDDGTILNAEGQTVRRHISHSTRPAIIRFLEKTQVSEILFFNGSPCWEWIGSKTRCGYGEFKIDGRRGASKSSPHRFAYLYFVGPIPDGYEVDHLCKVRHCCNPLHLEAVTLRVNRKRRFEDQTHCKRGHEFSGDNLYVGPKGNRICRQCRRERMREFHAKNPGYNAAQCRAHQARRRQHKKVEDAA